MAEQLEMYISILKETAMCYNMSKIVGLFQYGHVFAIDEDPKTSFKNYPIPTNKRCKASYQTILRMYNKRTFNCHAFAVLLTNETDKSHTLYYVQKHFTLGLLLNSGNVTYEYYIHNNKPMLFYVGVKPLPDSFEKYFTNNIANKKNLILLPFADAIMDCFECRVVTDKIYVIGVKYHFFIAVNDVCFTQTMKVEATVEEEPVNYRQLEMEAELQSQLLQKQKNIEEGQPQTDEQVTTNMRQPQTDEQLTTIMGQPQTDEQLMTIMEKELQMLRQIARQDDIEESGSYCIENPPSFEVLLDDIPSIEELRQFQQEIGDAPPERQETVDSPERPETGDAFERQETGDSPEAASQAFVDLVTPPTPYVARPESQTETEYIVQLLEENRKLKTMLKKKAVSISKQGKVNKNMYCKKYLQSFCFPKNKQFLIKADHSVQECCAKEEIFTQNVNSQVEVVGAYVKSKFYSNVLLEIDSNEIARKCYSYNFDLNQIESYLHNKQEGLLALCEKDCFLLISMLKNVFDNHKLQLNQLDLPDLRKNLQILETLINLDSGLYNKTQGMGNAIISIVIEFLLTNL